MTSDVPPFTRNSALTKLGSEWTFLGIVKQLHSDPGFAGFVCETGETIAAARTRAARVKAAAAMAAQPASTNGIGRNGADSGSESTKGIDIMRLSQKAFAKLDEDTLKSLRGDEVT